LRSAGITALPANQVGGFARGVDVEVNQEIEIGGGERRLFDRLGCILDVGVKEAATPD
jgi:hypothetical protein